MSGCRSPPCRRCTGRSAPGSAGPSAISSSIEIGRSPDLASSISPCPRDRARDALLVGIIEGETHAKDVASHEALAGVGMESRWVVVPAAVKQKGGDLADRSPIEIEGPASGPLWTWTTLTTTAASPGHLSRLRAA